MKIYIAADHAGLELKNELGSFLSSLGHEVEDCGAYEFDSLDDYPDFISKAALGVSENKESFGFVFGKSGTGEMICANKIKGIRCALAVNRDNVILSKTHNNANMLSMGSDFIDLDQMKTLAKLFIETGFSNEERHVRRLNKIAQIEQSHD
jgi:ribose 5-phosphate isomerase B